MGFGGISIWQLLIILAIIVLIFGTKRMRNLGSDLGNALRGFRKAVKEEPTDAEFSEVEDKNGIEHQPSEMPIDNTVTSSKSAVAKKTARKSTTRAKPAASRAKPAASRAKPAASRAKPAASRAKPAASRAKPAASRAKPAATTKSTVSKAKPRTTSKTKVKATSKTSARTKTQK